MQDKTTRIGVGLIIIKEKEVLLGRRKNAHGDGTYASPGGALQYMESPKQAVLRELREECGNSLTVSDPELLCVVNWEEYAPLHQIGIGFVAQYIKGEPQVIEPDKTENWSWYSLDNLPEPLFGIMRDYLEAYNNSLHYLES
jgi:8-oxo-dGTP diphosphatase